MPKITKARTRAQDRAQRRKSRETGISLPGGEVAAVRAGQGARNDIDRNPQAVAFAARERHGLTAEQARHEMGGCQVGKRLLIDHIKDRADLWEAVKHMRRVVLAYDCAIGAPSRHAQCLRIMLPTDRMEASASSPAPDLRTTEERVRTATSAYMHLQGWLGCTDNAARSACIRHVLDEPDEPILDWTGIVLALRCVSEGVKGDVVKVRVRRA